ncbi:excinuclease ABC subunit UvrC [Demequina sp. SYSU T00039]|uniref:UvrABC system protein C n=1 Tax=Demequina lignilytica TaxID=3051663 RepID=A0AAW7M990_9MICO|nr:MULTISPECIES: excinuclease ABC subunit UvrC [unclassified Demequina]MDN4479003.1 excinuclease ABC subunit UvrC [Demequina sp. SYSU T00039-1]MDN4489078.1 excinuclease ABC subunit UvrC [Demequina sp. SYSU T00039]MDN4491212.1 excinuclease ABC subunit UvrC [Demequina sp. SYSU T00068]
MTDPASYRPAPGSIPAKPGVYRFRDPHGRVVYVGKAKSLRARLANYFQDPAQLHPRTRQMVTTASSVDWTVVRSEVEALILEHTWIKQYDPRFNVVFKDDKSYPYLAVTMNEQYPRMQVMRGDRRKGVRYFGPYAKAWAIRETVDTLLTALPMRTCAPGVFRKAERQGRPCLLGYIDKCAAPCVGRVSEEEHRELAERVCQVLAGDAKSIVRDLTRSMQAAAEREDFEAAARARDRLRALDNVMARNAIVLAAGVDADVFSLADDELEAAAHVFHVRDGRIAGERGWVVDKPEPLDPAGMVGQLVQEAYGAAEREEIPTEVLVPFLPDDAPALTEWLSGVRGAKVSMRVPSRGKKAELAQTGAGNATQVLEQHRLKRASDLTTRSAALQELQDALALDQAPLRIECYDISHTQGTNQVGSMVVFEDAIARKAEYRQFSIADAVDDTAAMHEVLSRRFRRYLEESQLPPEERESARFAYPPQLVVVDGGLPQVNAARRTLDEVGVPEIAVVGLAKRLEEVWVPGDDFPVILPRGSEALYLLQRVRDEAHRFAIKNHRAKRTKAMKVSQLDQVAGVGPTRAKALITHFGSLARLKEASIEQIALVPGVGEGTARTVYAALHGEGGMLGA